MSKTKHQGLKAIALIKALRGTIALCTGIFLLRAGTSLTDPAKLKDSINEKTQDPALDWLLNYLGQVNKTLIYGIGLIALTLAAIRYIEAVGLWFEKKWAEWLALLTSLVYIPVELWHLSKGFNLFIVFILIINITICIYLLRMLRLKD